VRLGRKRFGKPMSKFQDTHSPAAQQARIYVLYQIECVSDG